MEIDHILGKNILINAAITRMHYLTLSMVLVGPSLPLAVRPGFLGLANKKV